MKKIDDAIELSRRMVEIGESAGRETMAIITNMDVPLGTAVGNDIEVIEAIETLQGKGPEEFQEICLEFAAYMLYLGEVAPLAECRKRAEEMLASGRALEKLAEMVKAQGGDETYIYHPEKFEKALFSCDFVMKDTGYITAMDTEQCGKTAMVLGAGRETKDSQIDPKAGIAFYRKTGEKVASGEVLATLYASEEAKLAEGMKCIERAYQFGEAQVEPMREILAYVTKDGVQRL